MTPAISVGLPVYNGARYLPQAIDSILTQTFGDFELIISDNASTDETAEICQYQARRDARVRYYRQDANIGAARNFNFVFRRARARYFKWASANDLCDPTLLRRCKVVLDARSQVVLCVGNTCFIDAEGHVVRQYVEEVGAGITDPGRRFLHIVDGLELNNAHAGLFRTAVLRRTRLEGPYPGSDVVLLAEVALHGEFHQLPDNLFFRRMAAGAATPLMSRQAIHQQYFPGRAYRAGWPKGRRMLGYAGAVTRAPISWGNKVGLYRALLQRVHWGRHLYWAELRSLLVGR